MFHPDPCTKARVKRWLTSDEAGLFILGSVGLGRAVSLAPGVVDIHRRPVHLLEQLFPPHVWGLIWLLISVGCFVAIVWRRSQPLAVAAMTGIHFFWAASYSFTDGRGWVPSMTYFSIFALILWAFARGRREPELVPHEPPKLE